MLTYALYCADTTKAQNALEAARRAGLAAERNGTIVTVKANASEIAFGQLRLSNTGGYRSDDMHAVATCTNLVKVIVGWSDQIWPV